ncbi:MAG: glycosyltransferase [Vicingus serpentipes]|nr:glycosyltransferase [Vicingus serpentipes]
MKKDVLKIATISTSNKGGAGIAAYRLHEYLNSSNTISSHFINAHSATDVSTSLYKELPLQKKQHELIIEKVNNKLPFSLFENKESTYKKKLNACFLDCEIATLPYSQYRIEGNEEVLSSDIVHLHWVADFLNYPTFFNKIKQPIVWTLHDMNPFQGIFHYKNDEVRNETAFKLNEKIFFKKKKAIHQHQNIHVVCLTDWMYQLSKNSEILGHYPHYLIPNGLDLTKFNPVQSKEAIKNKLGIDQSNKTLLFVSQDIKNYRKGVDLFINSLKLITEYSFNVISVGNNKIHLPPNITHVHIDHIDDDYSLNEIYSIADLYILPSREDNLPNVMLESFASGVPVIGFKVGGMKDWIIHGENGILVKEISSDLYAKELINFTNDKYSFDVESIKKYASVNFNQTNQNQKYIDLYYNILAHQ